MYSPFSHRSPSWGAILGGCLFAIFLFLLILAVESLVIGLFVWGAWNLILVAAVPTIAAITYGKAWLYGLLIAFLASLFTSKVHIHHS